jgi:CRISPR/Cas system-associated protein endoribonuclease Cas2
MELTITEKQFEELKRLLKRITHTDLDVTVRVDARNLLKIFTEKVDGKFRSANR